MDNCFTAYAAHLYTRHLSYWGTAIHLLLLSSSLDAAADPGFPKWGRQRIRGVPTSDTGTFWQKHMRKTKELGPMGAPAAPPRSATGRDQITMLISRFNTLQYVASHINLHILNINHILIFHLSERGVGRSAIKRTIELPVQMTLNY